MTTLQEKLIKIGAKVVRHARYVTFQIAEVAVPREFLAAIRERIRRFGVSPPLVQRGWCGDRTKADDSSGQRLMLRGNGPESLSRRRQRLDWPLGAGK